MKPFEKIYLDKPNRNVFDLSHERKFTMNMGNLVPVLVSETLPGDEFKVSMETLVRFHPMLAPVMHRINAYIHFFFVPNRLIWDDWEDFITGGQDGSETPNHPMFYGNNDDFLESLEVGGLADYLGYPVGMNPNTATSATRFSQLPFRAYQQIYNDYYRDANLTDEIDFSKSSDHVLIPGNACDKLITMRKRAWEKDYFTSALPNTQRGDEILLPLGDTAPLLYADTDVKTSAGASFPATSPITWSSDINGKLSISGVGQIGLGGNVDLSEATSASINDVRRAFALQRWMEKSMRVGSRYVEQILGFFGVRSDDARLQRAEYLGGGKLPIIISEVLQTSKTEVDQPLGDMGGHGYTAGENAYFHKYFKEHGFVIGIMSVIPRTAYFQGLPRYFSRMTKYDYYFPQLAHIGEQEVKMKEIYYRGTYYGTDEDTFGYQPRFEEYRYSFDTIHGDFRSSLMFWHQGRYFTSAPSLNTSFVEADPDDRIFAELDEDTGQVLVQTYANFKAVRPIVKHGNPI